MSKKKDFCPKCGKPGKGIGKKNLCKECWKEENELTEMPEEIEVEVCDECGFVKIEGSWKEFEGEEEMISRLLEKYLEDCEAEARLERKENRLEVDITCVKEVEGEKIKKDYKTEIIENRTRCPKCSRRNSGYYRYIIQLRGDKVEEVLRKVEKAAEKIQNRENYISRLEKVKNGFDVFLSSKKITENILKALKGKYSLEIKRSRKLIGEKEGEKIYRNYVSTRIKGEKNG